MFLLSQNKVVEIFVIFGLNAAVTKLQHIVLTADDGQLSDAVPTFFKYFYCNSKCLETKCEIEKQQFYMKFKKFNCQTQVQTMSRSVSQVMSNSIFISVTGGRDLSKVHDSP